MPEIRRLAGLVASLAAAVAWAVLAARSPTLTYHFAPLIVAGLWVGVDGAVGAGLTQRRIVNQALGGVALAAVTTFILDAKGDLAGPTFWDESDSAPVVAEHLVFAVVGGLIGAGFAIREASRPPRDV